MNQTDEAKISFQNKNAILLSKWHLDVDKINLVMIITMIVVEIIFYFLLDLVTDVDEPVTYFSEYLIRPAIYNFVFFGISKLCYRKKHLPPQTQALVPLIAFTLIVANIIRAHYVFTVLYAGIVIPIFLTILYGDLKITRYVFATSYIVFSADVFLILHRRLGGLPELFWFNVIIAYLMLPFCYFLVKSILRYESMKEKIIRDQSIAYDALKEELLYDGLTKIYNYMGLQNRLFRLVEDHKEDGRLYMAMLDVDHFKDVNDEFGHEAGNVVLERLGSLLAEERDANISVARYGGEEFAVLFENMSRTDCYSVLLSIFRKFQNSRFLGTPINRPITFSAGLVKYEKEMNATDFFEAADRMLYRAKAEGRAKIKVED